MDDLGFFADTSTMTGRIYVSNSYIAYNNDSTWNSPFRWNQPIRFDPEPIDTGFRNYDADALVKRHGRSLSPSEKAFIRQFNSRPTCKGIHACEKQHSEALERTEKLPGMEARYDRRVPRWKATRWKALT